MKLINAGVASGRRSGGAYGAGHRHDASRGVALFRF